MREKTEAFRAGRKQLAGHFSPTVIGLVRRLAAARGVTHQGLLAEALNDLFEKHGFGRLADEVAPPRGRPGPAVSSEKREERCNEAKEVSAR